MRIVNPGRILGLALVAAAVVTACGDDDGDNNGGGGGGGETASGGSNNASGGNENLGGGDTGSGGTGPETASLPKILTLSGCDDVLEGLCTVTQEGEDFTANCGGVIYSGQVSTDKKVSFSAADGASCEGELRGSVIVGTCAKAEATCSLTARPGALPGISCLELPSEFTNLTVTPQGATTAIQLGSCQVAQSACSFQATCGDDYTIVGTVSTTGASFTQVLPALADASVATDGATPAFLAGENVNHSCALTVAGTAVSGTCSAGASGGRGNQKPATSVYNIAAGATAVASCDLLAPSESEVFVLDSCPIMKEGESGVPGIGEPVCALRQNNCIWEVQCGPAQDNLIFGGRLQPGQDKVEFKLGTGTPCEASFDNDGNLTGKCTVPGQTACELKSKAPVRGIEGECPALPSDAHFYTNGCAGGDPLDCHVFAQHGCNFTAICDFSARYPNQVFAGEVSLQSGVPRMDFNGVTNYTCYTKQATAAEIEDGSHKANEWYGQCSNKEGAHKNWGTWLNGDTDGTDTGKLGQCRESGTFQGLQLFFGERPL